MLYRSASISWRLLLAFARRLPMPFGRSSNMPGSAAMALSSWPDKTMLLIGVGGNWPAYCAACEGIKYASDWSEAEPE